MTMDIDQQRYSRLKASMQATDLDQVAPVCIDSCDYVAAERERVERYIASIFSAAYGATVLEYLPLLVYMEQDSGFQAALGLRSASHNALFCEGYLDAPLERQVSREFGRSVNRGQLMELGNLVSSRPGQAVSLYLLVVAALGQAGISHLVFAANRAVRVSIRRCGFVTRELCPADPVVLGDHAAQWGSYYEGNPRVVLADIPQAIEHGKHHPVICAVWEREAIVIDALADAIRSQRV